MAHIYLVVLTKYMTSQQEKNQPSATFHQDGVHHLTGILKPSRFRAKHFLFTRHYTVELFVWGYVKDVVYRTEPKSQTLLIYITE